MPQLTVRGIEEEVIRKLKERALAHGISTQEEHRQILREGLLLKKPGSREFKRHLLAIPPGEGFSRNKTKPRNLVF